jgi:predicted DNA-binding transcriptional regulator AlpA
MLEVNFENLPSAVAEILRRQSVLEDLILNKSEHQPESDNPLNIKEAAKLIGKTVVTLYGYCQRNEMPFNRQGNRLIFFKSEIILWLKEGKEKTLKEIESDANLYLSNKNKGV